MSADPPIAARSASFRRPSRSPFGSRDEIGMLNLMTDATRARVVAEADGSKLFDLAVEYFVGMPSWTYAGDPGFQIWMSHTPGGTVVDDPMNVGEEHNRLVSYSGDCVAFYSHCGTHIDTLNHYGYCGKIWNGFTADEHLGARSWSVCGAEKQPPIVARGVLIDVARAHGLDVLPDCHAVGEDDLRMALDRQGSTVHPGDVVVIRTGRMRLWPDPDKYALNEPGINREGAEYLAEAGAIVIGADNLALEHDPGSDPETWDAVHTYLCAEAGVPIMEVINLEQLAEAELYEFAFISTGMRIRGATGAPAHPIAFPLRG